jgi:hypothetical protein
MQLINRTQFISKGLILCKDLLLRLHVILQSTIAVFFCSLNQALYVTLLVKSKHNLNNFNRYNSLYSNEDIKTLWRMYELPAI